MQIGNTTSILGTTSQNSSINIDENSSSSNEFGVLLENKTRSTKETRRTIFKKTTFRRFGILLQKLVLLKKN
ncbi:hypothetical protein ACN2C3_04460 [Aliarcobacter butzleri]